MAQFARPDADQATGSWTTTPLWSKVDEGTPGDDVTISSDAVGNNTNTSNADVRLSDITDPAVSTGHVIRARWNHDTPGRSLAAHCELWQGVPDTGTLRASLDVDPDVGSTETESEYTLTGTEADSITDYSNLYLRLWGRGTGGGPARALVVEFAELEVPDASGPTQISAAATGGVIPGTERLPSLTHASLAGSLASVARLTSLAPGTSAIGRPETNKGITKMINVLAGTVVTGLAQQVLPVVRRVKYRIEMTKLF